MSLKNDHFKKAIQDYLEKTAEAEPMFADKYTNPKKSIDECINFIFGKVKDSGRKGFTDPEIYGLARHYYDEDDVKVGKSGNMRVIVNHVPELTEQEKKELREKAQQEVIEAEKKRITTKKSPAVKRKPSEADNKKPSQLSLL